MASEGVPRFRLSVWRPAQSGRLLDYALSDADLAKAGLIFDVARLQEEIYHWTPGQEDVWSCITDGKTTNDLRELLFEGFAPNRSPEQRSMEYFRQSVDKFGTALVRDEVSTWADMEQTVKASLRESANLRGNSALSLWHHMEWIVRTFGSVPGASVTIR